jgi:hypothetical protein
VSWSDTEILTAAPSSPRFISHRERFGDDAANSATSALGALDFYTAELSEAELITFSLNPHIVVTDNLNILSQIIILVNRNYAESQNSFANLTCCPFYVDTEII